MFYSKRKIQQRAALIAYALLFGGCYLNSPKLCPAYVDKDYIQYGKYNWNEPLACSTWYEDPYGYMWSTDIKENALEKWYEISARPMYFEIDGEFIYTVRAKDGYEYTFWNMVVPEQYYITVLKKDEDIDTVGL